MGLGIRVIILTIFFVFGSASLFILPAQNTDVKKDAEEYLRIAMQLEKARLFNEAISQYNRAINLDPANIKAYINKGLSLKEIGRYQEAIDSFLEAIKIDPKYTDSYLYLGQTYLKKKDIVKAKEIYKALLEQDENTAKLLEEEISLAETSL